MNVGNKVILWPLKSKNFNLLPAHLLNVFIYCLVIDLID